MANDYYDVLGVDKNSSTEDIKKAYKKMAFEFHPDRNQDNPEAIEKFKEINEAYQVLGDENKRAQYDSFGHISGDNLFHESGFGNLNDLFGNLFEDVFKGGFETNNRKGRDLKYKLEITFEESAFGIEKEITVPKRELCEDCNGSGAAPEGKTICGVCNGRGSVDFARGFFAISQTCSTCRGSGKIITKYCESCQGDGFTKTEKSVKVKIPAGISNNSRLRIRGEGESALENGLNGDLFIIIFVKEHEIFKRDGDDIYCEVPINIIQASLGDEIEIPTLKEKEKYKIPPGTQPGQLFIIKGKGLPNLKTGKIGNLVLVIDVEVPQKLSSEQKNILKEFSKIYSSDKQPKIENYINKINNLLKK